MTINNLPQSRHFPIFAFLCITILSNIYPLSINAQKLSILGANGFCPSGSVTLIAADSFSNYRWSNGDTTRSITVNMAGNYTVIATNRLGRDTTVSKNIRAFATPQPTFGGTPYICPNRPTTIFVNENYAHYLWSNGDTTAQVTVSTPVILSVTVTDSNGCVGNSANDTIKNGGATLVPLPDSLQICEGDSATLNATAADAISYYWNTDDTTATLLVRTKGTYNVIISNGQCVSYDTTHVTTLPKPVVNFGNDTIICFKDTLLLRGPSSPLYKFIWQDSSRQTRFAASRAGVYYVRVSFGGCVVSDTITLKIFNQYQYQTFDTLTCENPYILNPKIEGATSYRWTDGSVDSTLKVVKSGNYQVIASNGKCFLDKRFNVNLRKSYKINLGKDTVLCRDLSQNELFLNAEIPNEAIYFWKNLDRSPTQTVKESGSYWVRVNNECGEMADTIEVTFRHCLKQFVPNIVYPESQNGNKNIQVYPTPDILRIRSFKIFDRWGTLVFEAKDFAAADAVNFAWHGDFKGRGLTPNVFVYYLECETKDKEIISQSGDITLVR